MQKNYKNLNLAARVLQSTWRVVRWQKRLENCRTPSKSIMLHLRLAQRKFLQYVLEFRQTRWKMRLKFDEEDDIITVRRVRSILKKDILYK